MPHRLVLSAVLASLFVASPVARAHGWYPLKCCGDEDCGPGDSVVHAGETDWDRQMRAFDDHLMGLFEADARAPSSPYMPVPPVGFGSPSTPVYDPDAMTDQMMMRQGNPRIKTRRSY